MKKKPTQHKHPNGYKKKRRMGKLTCPYCPGQIYYRKTLRNWKCWRCHKVIT